MRGDQLRDMAALATALTAAAPAGALLPTAVDLFGPSELAADASSAVLLADDSDSRPVDSEVDETLAEEDQAEVLAASRDNLAAIIESDLEVFLDYDFSNSTCQAIFSSGTVDAAASAQKPAQRQRAISSAPMNFGHRLTFKTPRVLFLIFVLLVHGT